MPTSLTKLVMSPSGLKRQARVDWLKQSQTELLAAWRRGERLYWEDVHKSFDGSSLTTEERLLLIECEISVRREIGEHPTHAEYSKRYPMLAESLARFFSTEVTQLVKGSVPQPLTTNTTTPRIDGYEIIDMLGRGGMGVVYKARQHGLNRLVALKMILAGRYAGDEELARFRREAEAVAALDHPNIVRVYEVGEHEGTPFISLEYVGGGTLAEILRRGPLTSHDAVLVAEAIARAAHEAHQHGIVHRDLKPANILLETRVSDPSTLRGANALSRRIGGTASIGTPKITDFGIAKKLDDTRALTASGIAAGTPQYMAPEQAMAKKEYPVGAQADVYAIGVILYEMLTNHTPFEGDNPVDIMQRVVTQSPPVPSRYKSNISRDLETIILKCLEKSPARRYSTAEALADDLACWQQGKPIAARPVGRSEQAWRWCQRNPLLSSLLAGIFLALSCGIVASTWFALDARDAARQAKHEHTLAVQAEADARAQEREAKSNADIAARHAAEAKRHSDIAENKAAEARLAQAHANQLRQEAIEREQRRSRELYAADMLLAYADGLSGHLLNTQQLLKKYRPNDLASVDQRGFEWHYINRLTMAYETVYDRMEMKQCVAVPKSSAFALVGRQQIVVCDPSQQRVVERIAIPIDKEELNKAVFSSDGEHIACLFDGPTLALYHRPTKKIVQRFVLHSEWHFMPQGAIFSHDGKTLYVAVGSDRKTQERGAVIAFDVATGAEQRRYEGLNQAVLTLALSPDSRFLYAGGHDSVVRCWEAETGKDVGQIEVLNAFVVSLAYPKKGNVLAIGTSRGTVMIVDPTKHEFLRELHGHKGLVHSLTFADDGTTLASAASETMIRVWNALTGEEIRVCHGHRDRVNGLAFGTQSSQLVSTGRDRVALLWDVHQHPQATTINLGTPTSYQLLRLPDAERVLVSNQTNGYQFLNIRTRELTPITRYKGLNDFIDHAAISADGTTLALCAKSTGIAIVSLEKPDEEPRIIVEEKLIAYRVAFSPDGRSLVVGRRSGEIIVYPTNDYTSPRTIANLRRPIISVAFPHQDCSTFATACMDGTVRVWDMKSGKEQLVVQHEDMLPSHVTYSPDGQTIAVACSDGVTCLRQAQTGRMLQRFRGHTKPINYVSFDPRGRRLITGSEDMTVRLWDVETGMTTLILRGHVRGVSNILMSNDERTLVTLAYNQLKMWEAGPSHDEEDGRMLVLGTTLREAQMTYDPVGLIRGTVRGRNISGRTLTIPHSARPMFGMRLHLTAERIGDDPSIPALGRKPDDYDQYPLGWSRMLPNGKQLLPDQEFEFSYSLPAKNWPSGKYRMYHEHSWPGEDRNLSAQTRATLVIPASK